MCISCFFIKEKKPLKKVKMKNLCYNQKNFTTWEVGSCLPSLQWCFDANLKSHLVIRLHLMVQFQPCWPSKPKFYHQFYSIKRKLFQCNNTSLKDFIQRIILTGTYWMHVWVEKLITVEAMCIKIRAPTKHARWVPWVAIKIKVIIKVHKNYLLKFKIWILLDSWKFDPFNWITTMDWIVGILFSGIRNKIPEISANSRLNIVIHWLYWKWTNVVNAILTADILKTFGFI